MHVHIKDAVMKASAGEPEYTLPGEGNANIEAILQELIRAKYDGFIAIEPHMGKVFHLQGENGDERHAYDIYVEYGKKFERLIGKVQTQFAGD